MAIRDELEQTVDQGMGSGCLVVRNSAEVRWSDERGQQAARIAERALLGSAEDVDLRVADPAVSRLHAECELKVDGLWIRDLDSRNGTFVEGVRVGLARIPQGGRVQLGDTVMTVSYDSTPQPVDLWPEDRFGPLLGRSAPMRELFATISRVAATDFTVLVQGETGTGKELIASAIHEASSRVGRPFLIVDCGRMTENFIEDELFGHVKGAFTGAATARAGAIEQADKGTVFLDEIGELPPSLQTQLLRVLERRMVRRIGSEAYKTVDVRFVAATHRNLRKMVSAGAFREDLYFRLAVLPVVVPPLRERPEDIAMLVEHFLPPGAGNIIKPEEMRDVIGRPWLGNVRELRNFVERAQAFGVARALAMTAPDESEGTMLPPVPIDRPFKEVREQWTSHIEHEYLRRALEKHGGNVTAVAEAAGMDRSYVHDLIRKHQLKPLRRK